MFFKVVFVVCFRVRFGARGRTNRGELVYCLPSWSWDLFGFVFGVILCFFFNVVEVSFQFAFLWFRGGLGGHSRTCFWKCRDFSETGWHLGFERPSYGFDVFSKIRASREASNLRKKRHRETSGIFKGKRYGPGWIFPFGVWGQSGLQNLTCILCFRSLVPGVAQVHPNNCKNIVF